VEFIHRSQDTTQHQVFCEEDNEFFGIYKMIKTAFSPEENRPVEKTE
jgi:hypothetical protein